MSGDAALGMVAAGTLLIFAECNRPGRVLPGACGLLLLLLGVNSLRTLGGWSGGLVAMGVAGVLLIAVMRWRLLLCVPGVAGTALLTAALVQLARRTDGALGSGVAAACGSLLGLTSSCLMVIAGRAWRAKAGHRGAAAERAQSGAVERWGVD